MWFRRFCAAIIVGSLVLLPVVASDDTMEGDYETVTDSSSESDGPVVSSDPGADVSVADAEPSAAPEPSAEPAEDMPQWVEDQAQRDETMNNNLAMLAGCIMACGGMLIGYWTGSDLLSIWHK